MICKKCGKTIADDSRFCRFCGTELKEHLSSIDGTDYVEVVNFNDKDETTSKESVPFDGNSKPKSIIKDEDSFDNKSLQENKIMKGLGIISGIILWGFLALMVLVLVIGFLFILYGVIMMNMPNGRGIALFSIILLLTIYGIVKLIIANYKEFKK